MSDLSDTFSLTVMGALLLAAALGAGAAQHTGSPVLSNAG